MESLKDEEAKIQKDGKLERQHQNLELRALLQVTVGSRGLQPFLLHLTIAATIENDNSEKQKSPSDSAVFERKARVAWSAAKGKASYKSFEDEVLKKTKKDKGTAKDKLSKLAKTIYAVGMDTFGEEPGKRLPGAMDLVEGKEE